MPKLNEVPDGWHFYDPETGDELKAAKSGLASVQIVLPEEAAIQVLATGELLIAEEDLGTKGREDEPHITVKYGVRVDGPGLLDALVEFYPVYVTLGKIKVFAPSENSGGQCPVVVEVIAPVLQQMHDRVNDTIGCRHDNFDYAPHVTLAYVKSEAAAKYDGSAALEGVQFTASLVELRRKGGKVYSFDLGGADLVGKAGEDDEIESDIDEILADIMRGFEELVEPVTHELSSTYLAQAKELRDELNAVDKVQLSSLNEQALIFAQDRGAELVGMKWVGKKLVENPNARWAITDTTRNVLRVLVSNAFSEGMTPAQLTQAIEDTGIFSAARADMIASTEMSRAQVQGALKTAKDVGVIGKEWETSGDHDIDDECDLNEDDGIIALDETFTSGDDGPPGHPNCNCAVVFYTAEDPEAADLLVDEEEEEAA